MQAATSLVGVESLIEHRYRADLSMDKRLLRLSVGVEELEVSLLFKASRLLTARKDLKADLRQAFNRLVKVRMFAL